MNNKVILVVLDGLSYQVARDCMGYLNGLVEQPHSQSALRTTLYQLKSELPSMSRPLYECILTGIRPIESGIVNNANYGAAVQRIAALRCKISETIAEGVCKGGLRTPGLCRLRVETDDIQIRRDWMQFVCG